MPVEPLCVTNRAVAVLLPKAPFVEWINAADPGSAGVTITYDDAREEPSAFLIPTDDTDDLDEPGKRWIQRNWRRLFEHLLEDWYVDPDLWPRNRTIEMFRQWCEIHIHSMVFDYADTPLEYDD